MLQIAQIKENQLDFEKRLAKRGLDSKTIITKILDKDELRRNLQTHRDQLLASANALSAEIGSLYKEGKTALADEKKTQSQTLKEQSKTVEMQLEIVENDLKNILNDTPNVPHAKVPEGKTPEDNVEVFKHGSIPQISANAKPHWEIVGEAGMIDFELGVKVTGAGFPVYIGAGAKLQRALINFFLDEAGKAGYTEVQVPILVNKESAYGTGQLPDKDGQMYFANEDNLYLIPTAEVPITNIFRDVILPENSLPQKRVGYTPCFRREAGSYGKDVRGLNRLHQFEGRNSADCSPFQIV